MGERLEVSGQLKLRSEDFPVGETNKAPVPVRLVSTTPTKAIGAQRRSASEGTAALEKALDIFEAISAEPNGVGQLELSAKLNVPRTTLYRLLASLVSRGLVRRDPVRRVYCLGFKCFELARRAHSSGDLVAAAAGEMRNLRDLTGETVYLGVMDGHEVLSVETFEGAHSERSAAGLGQRKPLFATSLGKAMLAALPESRREALVREMQLRPITPTTITDRRRLNAELKISAARGYAIDNEEILTGVRCAGAAIIDQEGRLRGAISVSGPAWRMTLARLEDIGPELADAARRIGAQLADLHPARTNGQARTLPGPRTFSGVYPQYCQKTSTVFFADALAPVVMSQRLGSQDLPIEIYRADYPIQALVMLDSRRLLLKSGDQYQVIEIESDHRAPVTMDQLKLDPNASALTADAQGNIWMCTQGQPGQWIVGRVGVNGQIEAQWRFTEALNYLCWDPSGTVLHGGAAQSGSLLVMQPGKPNARRLATVSRGSGVIAGLAVDQNQGAWVCLADGWSVVRFSPDGVVDQVVSMPVPQPTGIVLTPGRTEHGEPSFIVTTSRRGVPVDTLVKAPDSGQLFELYGSVN